MGVNSINGISSINIDSEYMRIFNELIVLGVRPTGNKSTDRMKLQQAKSVKKAQEEATPLKNAIPKDGDNIPKLGKFNDISIKDDTQVQKEIAMASMTGASNLSKLNKKMFGL